MVEKHAERMYNLPLGGGNALGDLSTVNSVVHEEHIDVGLVADEELLESVSEEVSSLLLLLVTDFHFLLHTSPSSSGLAINTSDSSVRFLLNAKKVKIMS
jgi:hypothetical protein